MRCIIEMKSKKEQSYISNYHHKLRGVIWDKLNNTKYQSMHSNRKEIPFVFSNIFPVRDMSEGDISRFIVSSPHNGVIDKICEDTRVNENLYIGDLAFNIEDITQLSVDAGEPGESGRIETSTGVYVPIRKDEWNEFNIDPPYNTDKVGWTNEYDYDIFLEKITENLSWKQDILYGDYLDKPNKYELFDEYEYKKGYSIDTKVSSDNGGYTYTFIVSKWNFNYTVRNDDHRRWINIALDCGLGWRNSLGFGFINKVIEDE